MNQLSYKKYIGAEIEQILAPLSQLRIAVFRDFPYLYEGSFEYEMEYLQVYVNAPEAMVFTVWDKEQLVGACTCIPLSDESPEVQEPFIQQQIPIERVFYFGESLLLKAYRGQGIGHLFFDEREQHAQSFGFQEAYFCAVIRPENHELKPTDYYPNDVFWSKRKYTKQPELVCSMSWLDLNEKEETSKDLVFWKKSLKD